MKTFVTACRRCALALVCCAAAAPALAGPVSLAPALAGQYRVGTGVDARFLKVDNDWKQSSVPWDGTNYGSGTAIGTFPWGTGLWGLADWRTANLASPPVGMIEGSWSGRVTDISFGNEVYNALYGNRWGAVTLAPLFTPSSGQLDLDKCVPLSTDECNLQSQNNWTSAFAGYIRISEAGAYNFSVLYDDGFFFRLGGANGATLELDVDYLNARDRLGFDTDLQLDVGLYAFELGAYDRLQAGVVELSWKRGDGDFTPVPTANLVAAADVRAIPEPGTSMLMLGGLLALAAATSRRRAWRH